MGPTWVLSATDGSHDGPMNLDIREYIERSALCAPVTAAPICSMIVFPCVVSCVYQTWQSSHMPQSHYVVVKWIVDIISYFSINCFDRCIIIIWWLHNIFRNTQYSILPVRSPLHKRTVMKSFDISVYLVAWAWFWTNCRVFGHSRRHDVQWRTHM